MTHPVTGQRTLQLFLNRFSTREQRTNMGFADKLNQLTKKAKDAAVDHKDQVEKAVEKAAVLADQRTGGKYHDQVAKAEAKADAYLEHQAQHPSTATPPETARPQAETEPREKPAGTP